MSEDTVPRRQFLLGAGLAGTAIAASDVCVEFPSVIALVAAGRGAAIIPRLTLADAPVATCSLPELGGRHIAALHRTGTGYPAPATATVLATLAETGQRLLPPLRPTRPRLLRA